MANKIKFNTPESLIYVGLDCETSSDNFQTGRPIQIGISIYVAGQLKEYQSYINHRELDDWSAEAENIHHISPQTLLTAPEAQTVDEELFQWLNKELDYPAINSLVAVGWNVNSFDFHFLKPILPLTMGLFSRRVVELNSLIHLYSQTSLVAYRTFDELKEIVKSEGRETLDAYNIKGKEHQAAYDSALGLAIFSNLKDLIR